MYAKQTKPRIRTATYVTVVGRHSTRTGTLVSVGDASAGEQPATHYPRTVVDLVNAARAGDQGSWNDLVDRFLPLVASVIARYRLQQSDADDVNQTVWLRLVEHLDDLREPRALPGWLATTARNESLQVIRRRGRDTPVDPQAATMARADDLPQLDENVIREERLNALREAMLELPPQRRELLELLMADPPISYDQISATLGIPKGSIGPTRARALEQLRHTRAIRTLATTDWDAAATTRYITGNSVGRTDSS
jgi:RNA polymerase sigma factor (sigma-70 family)